MEYLALKWIHILSATIVFGTGIGTAFYMFMANRRNDIAGICFATRHVVIADWLFTTPAIIIQLLTGIGLVNAAGYDYSDPWIFWSLVLFVFAGACWLPVLWLQLKMRDMARLAMASGEPLPKRYWQMDRLWIILGSLAFPAVTGIFYLMVVKPG